MIFYILGMASGFEALFLLLPILVSLIYGESVLSSYLISCGICAFILRGSAHFASRKRLLCIPKKVW